MSLANLAATLRDAIFQSRQSASELKVKLAELRAERTRIATAPLCRADLESLVLSSLQRQRQRALVDSELMAVLQYGHGLAGAWCDNPDAAHLADVTPLFNRYDSLASQNEWDRLALLLGSPETILAALKPLFDSMDFSQAGRPMASRRTKIQQLDKEIAALESELKAIEAAILATADVAPAPAPTEIPYGTRKELEPGVWATWGAMYSGGQPGWIHDQ